MMEYLAVTIFGGHTAYKTGTGDGAFPARSVADMLNHFAPEGWELVPHFHRHHPAPSCDPNIFSDDYLLVRVKS